MFSKSAELYDLIYASFKNYEEETERLAAILEAVRPGCHTVLDVACGTGEHARLLAERHGFEVDGVDLDPAFVQIARRKHPAGTFTVGDMSDFHLERRYDAVICLFSSIGYVRTLDRVSETIARFREHVAPSGVIVVEPWFAPGILQHGYVATNAADANGVHVVRRARTEIDGRISRLYFEYDVTDHGRDHHATEVHELGLFTPDEMRAAFEQQGLTVEHDPKGLTGRGLYVARS